MRDSISKTNINKFMKEFNSSSTGHITRNALVRSNINDVAMDWDGFRLLDHTYSDVISTEMSKVAVEISSSIVNKILGKSLDKNDIDYINKQISTIENN